MLLYIELILVKIINIYIEMPLIIKVLVMSVIASTHTTHLLLLKRIIGLTFFFFLKCSKIHQALGYDS